jgi:CBS domain containing-hemolysin-like protein
VGTGSDLSLLLIYLSLAIGVSFACSIAEAVLLSITPSFIAERESSPTRTSRRIVALKRSVDRPLAAILSLNTIAHTVGAAGVGSQTAKILGDHYVGVASGLLTLLILVLSEIIPKTLGTVYWRRLAGPIAIPVTLLIFLAYPLVRLSEFLTTKIAGNDRASSVTRSEIAALAEVGTREGLFCENESQILRNLLRMRAIGIEGVMTPAQVVVSREQSDSIADIAEELPHLTESRILLYHGRRDRVTGFALKTDLLAALAAGTVGQPLSDYQREIASVHSDDSAHKVLNQLLNARQHIAVVCDQHGNLVGVVTLEDLVETLLGSDITDEQDAAGAAQPLAQPRSMFEPATPHRSNVGHVVPVMR